MTNRHHHQHDPGSMTGADSYRDLTGYRERAERMRSEAVSEGLRSVFRNIALTFRGARSSAATGRDQDRAYDAPA